MAQVVDAEKAKVVAKNFFTERLLKSKQMTLKGTSPQNLEFILGHEEKASLSDPGSLKNSSQALPLYYIFNVIDRAGSNGKSGFIIISADERIPVVLGYSFTGEFPELDQPSALKGWLDHYEEQIIYVIQSDVKADPEIRDKWKKYSGTGELKSTEQINELGPLLTTEWCQYGFYNNLCPEDSRCGTLALNGHVYAGCVAVAMAQIMKYWEYPVTNNPIPGYTSENYGPQPDIGETAYDWPSMSDRVDAPMDPAPTTAEIDAVSTLVYHCGVAVEMNYSYQGSGAGSPQDAFRDYFKYSPDMQDVDRSLYTDEEWGNLLREELDNGRPVFYSGYADDSYNGGHSFVCDGYSDEDLFHFNWGLSYGGGGNGLYHVGDIANESDLTPGSKNFNYKQWAIIAISPASSLIDRDGNYYDVVQIGSQVWMAENLKTTKYNDGTDIANPGTDGVAWESNTSGAYSWYDNNDAYKNTYGAQYNWHAVNTDRLCPSGWHVPTFREWLNLMTFLGDGSEFEGRQIAGGLLKEAGYEHWTPDNEGATDAFGFRALPGGHRTSTSIFFHLGWEGIWWASGNWWQDDALGTSFMMFGTSAGVPYGGTVKNAGLSVRCMQDASETDIPVDSEAFAYADLEYAGEEDWFRFQTGQTGVFVMETRGGTDTFMELYNEDQSVLIAENNDGAGSGQNARIIRSLDANTVYYIRITGNNGSIGDYSVGVNTMPDAPVADNFTTTYDGLEHMAGASVPPGISIVWFDAATGGNETTQPTATASGTYTAYAEAVNEVSGYTSLSRTAATLTINLAVLTVSADNQSSQYSDPLKDLTYTMSGFVNGENSSVLSGAPGISTSATQFSAPGVYNILIGTGDLSALNYSFIFVNGTYTISQEDARVEYTGNSLVATSSATSGEALITLRASVQDISASPDAGDDNDPGDIRNASVRFLRNGIAITGTGTDPDGWMTPTLLNPSDQKTGVVQLNWPVNIGDNNIAEYTVGIEVNDYYLRNDLSDNLLLTVYKPAGDFITGGGYIINPDHTGGVLAADPGLNTNFGFNVKFNKKGDDLDGNMNAIFRKTIGGIIHNFQIKSTSMTSLGVNTGNPEEKTAMFISNVSLTDLTDPVNGYSKDGLTLQVTMTDRGNPGRNDAIAISVYDQSLLVFSSNWTGISSAETLLGGGNLVIHSGFSLDSETKGAFSDLSGITEINQPEFKVIAYPNPFDDRIYFDLQLLSDSEVKLEIFDITGSIMATVYDDILHANVRYRFEYTPENLIVGTLIYRVTLDGKQMFTGKLIRQ